MSTNLFERHVRAPFASPDQDESEAVQDCGAFGFLRGIRDRAIMLELRKKDGSMRALGYAWLQAVDFDPSRGIVLTFPGIGVTLTGSNLNTPNTQGISLLAAVIRHRATFIQEADEVKFMEASRTEAVVEAMRW